MKNRKKLAGLLNMMIGEKHIIRLNRHKTTSLKPAHYCFNTWNVHLPQWLCAATAKLLLQRGCRSGPWVLYLPLFLRNSLFIFKYLFPKKKNPRSKGKLKKSSVLVIEECHITHQIALFSYNCMIFSWKGKTMLRDSYRVIREGCRRIFWNAVKFTFQLWPVDI